MFLEAGLVRSTVDHLEPGGAMTLTLAFAAEATARRVPRKGAGGDHHLRVRLFVALLIAAMTTEP